MTDGVSSANKPIEGAAPAGAAKAAPTGAVNPHSYTPRTTTAAGSNKAPNGSPAFQLPGTNTGAGVAVGDKTVAWTTRAYVGSMLSKTTEMLTEEQAITRMLQMSMDEKRMLAQSLYKAGIIGDPNDFSKLYGVISDAVKMAALSSSSSKQISPWDAIGMMMEFNVGKDGTSAGGKPPRTTDSVVNIPSPSDAKSLITSIFQKGIGRDPTEDEVKKYTAMVVGVAKKNPTTSTTDHTYDASGSQTGTSTVNQGGPDYNQIVTDQMRTSPEYGAYQAATTYYNALQQAFASPV